MKKITALMAVGSLALAACGSSGYSGSGSSSSSASSKTAASSSGGGYGGGYGKPSSSTSTSSNASVSNGSGAITVTMNDNYFGTKTITGKPGSSVKVTLTNKGTRQHNFKIDGQKLADADVPPGKTGHAVVKIPTSGTLQFYCEYHKGLGMVGTVKPA